MKAFPLFISILLLSACAKEEPMLTEVVPENIPEESNYFPPTDGSTWSTLTNDELSWNETKLEELYSFLEENETRAFMIIKDGKIAAEKYWGKNYDESADFTASTNWYWASAAKTLTATLVGIAQEEGHLNITDKTSEHLGEGWTNMSLEKENLITIKHQLSMNTGLDYTVPNNSCTDVECLDYRADAGSQWFYHNAPYTLLDEVVSNATQETYNNYSTSQFSKFGMSGAWLKIGFFNLYWSTARDAARFGLLMLNQGKWEDSQIINKPYVQEMTSTSQDINPSYGYLWWLNGKESIVYPLLENSFNVSLAPKGPADMVSAMGKDGQFIDVVPSMNLVVVRMGLMLNDAPLVPVALHNDMWEKIMEIF